MRRFNKLEITVFVRSHLNRLNQQQFEISIVSLSAAVNRMLSRTYKANHKWGARGGTNDGIEPTADNRNEIKNRMQIN